MVRFFKQYTSEEFHDIDATCFFCADNGRLEDFVLWESSEWGDESAMIITNESRGGEVWVDEAYNDMETELLDAGLIIDSRERDDVDESNYNPYSGCEEFETEWV